MWTTSRTDRRHLLLAAAAIVLAFASAAPAQCRRWDRGPLTAGTFYGVYASAEFQGLYVGGGNFQAQVTAGGVASNIFLWDGLDVMPLGAGTNGTVWAMTAYAAGHTSSLIAAGDFTTAGTVSANRIAIWSSGLPGQFPSWAPLGAGFNGSVYAVERFNNEIYAAGSFSASGTTAVNRIARYNSTTRQWVPLGSGLNGTALAMRVYNGALYVGGTFTSAGGVATGALARWDGAAWSAVGGTFGGSVYALETFTPSAPGYLMIGGSWGGGSPNLVAWSVDTYTNLITGGGTNGPIFAFAADNANSRLYAGGSFFVITGRGCGNTAVLSFVQNGGWDPLQGGTDAPVYTMRVFHGEVVTGGASNTAGGISRPRIARWLQTGSPWIARNPQPMTSCPSSATFTVREAAGYEDGIAYTWRHDSVTMVDGPTATGSTIVGAHARTLQIQGAGNDDEGTYYCIVSNSCGAAVSSLATLHVCAGDLDCSGQTDPADISLFVSRWLGSLEQGDLAADYDHNGSIEPADVSRFVAAWYDEVVNGC